MRQIIVYGAGALAREVVGHHRAAASARSPDFEFVGYFSDAGPAPQFELETGLPYMAIGWQAAVSDHEFLLCIADPHGRSNVAEQVLAAGGRLASYWHPTAIVLPSAQLGPGCILFPHVVISSNAKLGAGVVLNSYTGVGHDVVVGDYTTVSAQVDLMGRVQVGRACFFGSGARVVPDKKIGAGCRIGVGVAVIKSLPPGVTVLPLANQVMRFE